MSNISSVEREMFQEKLARLRYERNCWGVVALINAAGNIFFLVHTFLRVLP